MEPGEGQIENVGSKVKVCDTMRRPMSYGVLLGGLLLAPSCGPHRPMHRKPLLPIMSLQDKVFTGPKGPLTSPQAAAMVEGRKVQKSADSIYRIGGWGIANIIAVEAPEGWITVDAGDFLEVAREQRRALEDKLGKIKVAAVLYLHPHSAVEAKARQVENTQFY